MSAILLLGAGASIKAGVPNAVNMTKEIIDKIGVNRSKKKIQSVLRFVTGGLMFHAAINNGDPYGGVNIEDLFNAIDTLSNRGKMEAAPFIGSWHEKINSFEAEYPDRRDYKNIYESIYYDLVGDLKDYIESSSIQTYSLSEIDQSIKNMATGGNNPLYSRESIAEKIEKALKKIPKAISHSLQNTPRSRAQNFENGMDHLVRKIMDSKRGTIFAATMDEMIKELKNIVWISDHEKVTYLKPIIDWCFTAPKRAIATLNYDNSIELCAASFQKTVNTSLNELSSSGDFNFKGNEINLLKLHGSIDWVFEKNGQNGLQHKFPHVISNEGNKFDDKDYKPAVIFGQKIN